MDRNLNTCPYHRKILRDDRLWCYSQFRIGPASETRLRCPLVATTEAPDKFDMTKRPSRPPRKPRTSLSPGLTSGSGPSLLPRTAFSFKPWLRPPWPVCHTRNTSERSRAVPSRQFGTHCARHASARVMQLRIDPSDDPRSASG